MIGWTASADPMAGLVLKFDDEGDAVRFCDKMGWNYRVSSNDENECIIVPKNYADNFTYSKERLKIIRTK